MLIPRSHPKPSAHSDGRDWLSYLSCLMCVCVCPGTGTTFETHACVRIHQYCTEMFMPLGTDGVHDMFWYAPWNSSAAEEACLNEFGVRPRALWPKVRKQPPLPP